MFAVLRAAGSFIRGTDVLRNLSLHTWTQDLLRFTTVVQYEPVIGFSMPPTVSFLAHQHRVATANTCTNTLYLPIPLYLPDTVYILFADDTNLVCDNHLCSQNELFKIQEPQSLRSTDLQKHLATQSKAMN